MPGKKLKINDYFYEFAGTPENKIITREMYQEIARKMALHSVVEYYAKNKTMIDESRLETYIVMNDMQCQLAAENRPDIYDLNNSEINNSGFAPKAGTVSIAKSAEMVNVGVRSLIDYALSEEGFKEGLINEYRLQLKADDDTYLDVFNQLTEEEKLDIELELPLKINEEGYETKSPDEIVQSIKFISKHKEEYDSLSLGTRFMAFFGFGKAANLRKAIYGNMSKLENHIDKTVLNETLANPTENNLVASVNSYLNGANRKDEVVVINRLIDEKEVLNHEQYLDIEEKADEIENAAMEVNPPKSQVNFPKEEFNEDDNELNRMGDDEDEFIEEEGPKIGSLN